MSGGGPSGGGSSTTTTNDASIAPQLQPLVTASAEGTMAAQRALPLTAAPTGTYYDPFTGMPAASPYGPFTTLNPMQVPTLTPMEHLISAQLSAYPFAMNPNLALGPLSSSPTPTVPFQSFSPVSSGATGGGENLTGSTTGITTNAITQAPTTRTVPVSALDRLYYIEQGVMSPGAFTYDPNTGGYTMQIEESPVPSTSISGTTPSATTTSGVSSGTTGGQLESPTPSVSWGTSPSADVASLMGVPPLNPRLFEPFDLAKQNARSIMGPLDESANYLAMRDDFTRNIAPLVQSTAVGKGYQPTSGAMLETLGNAAAGAVLPLAMQQKQLQAGLVPSLTALGAAEPATIIQTLKDAEAAAALPRTVATTQAQADYNAFQQLLDLAKQVTLGPTQTVLPGMITAGPSTTSTEQPMSIGK